LCATPRFASSRGSLPLFHASNVSVAPPTNPLPTKVCAIALIG